jgi:uncharacterized protein YoaH (UPF0181 family)
LQETHQFLQLIKRWDQVLHSSLQSQLASRGLRSLIKTTEFQHVLSLLANLSEPDNPQWAASLDAIPDHEFDEMIQCTLAFNRSIGNLHWKLRKFRETDPALLEKLERRIGAELYLHLIASAGTIYELFMVIQYSSPSMTGELIEALDAETLDTLIAQTIASGRSIGTLGWTLRELKKTDPALLEKLERRIGAERYLHLIASAGTIYELFRVIQYSSPSMTGELIEALDAETLDTLIAQTIASGRSIGTLDWTLRELKKTDPALLEKLERRIGVKRWWQLICANGTMHILTQILQHLDRFFRQELAESSQELSLDEWQELLLRGHFADLCHFIRWKAHLFSAQFTSAFLDSLEPTFKTLIRGADWTVLGRGMEFLAAASESSIKQYLLALLHDYVAAVKLNSLRFDSFDEATACMSLLWHQLPSQRQELMNSLLAILPEEDVWYASERFLRLARLLFFILADPQAQPDDSHRVLSIGNDQAVASLFAKATTLDLFLYLWNLYSLWFQREKEGGKTFADFLHPAIQSAVTGALVERFQAKTDQAETDNLIALAGFVSFSGLVFDPAEKIDWVSSLPSFEKLLKRASSKTFIPAVFFLLGLEWIFDSMDGIPSQTWQDVLPKAEEYVEKPAALEHLRDLVRARADSVACTPRHF